MLNSQPNHRMHTNTPAKPDYTAWASIDYRPAIRYFLPVRLLPLLGASSSVLDIGCNKGDVDLYLALSERGHDCTGIDINATAIATARGLVSTHEVEKRVTLEVVDFLEFAPQRQFDSIIMIRLLTCMPQIEHWRACLGKALAMLRPGGLLYAHDFAMLKDSYGSRYAQGAAQGWREGSFPAKDPTGIPFIAHHHSESDLDELAAPYETVWLNRHLSTSMNGNSCSMFEFIGRKPKQ